VTILLSFS